MQKSENSNLPKYISIFILVVIAVVALVVLFAPMPQQTAQQEPVAGELEEALEVEVISQVAGDEITFTSSQEATCRADNNASKVLNFKNYPLVKDSKAWSYIGGNNLLFGLRSEDARIILSGDPRKVLNFNSTSFAGIAGKPNLRRGDYSVAAELAGIEFNTENNLRDITPTPRERPLSPEEELLDFFDGSNNLEGQNKPINPAVVNRYLTFRLTTSRFENQGEFILRVYVIPSKIAAIQGLDRDTVIVDLVRVVAPGQRRLISSTDVSRNSNIANIVADIANMGIKMEFKTEGDNIFPTVSFRDLKLGTEVNSSTIWHTVKLAPRGIRLAPAGAVRNWGADLRNVLPANVVVNSFKLSAAGCLPADF